MKLMLVITFAHGIHVLIENLRRHRCHLTTHVQIKHPVSASLKAESLSLAPLVGGSHCHLPRQAVHLAVEVEL